MFCDLQRATYVMLTAVLFTETSLLFLLFCNKFISFSDAFLYYFYISAMDLFSNFQHDMQEFNDMCLSLFTFPLFILPLSSHLMTPQHVNDYVCLDLFTFNLSTIF